MAESEIIPKEMEQTRQSLADKIETLERKVANTVDSVAETVKETVESVTDKVQKTVESVTGTVESVTERVDSAKEAVQDTMESVKEGLYSAKESVKQTVSDAFDLPSHVRNYPWASFGGSVVVGFLAGKLFGAGSSHGISGWGKEHFQEALSNFQSESSHHNGRSYAAEPKTENGYSNGRSAQGSQASEEHGSSWMDWLNQSFGSEIQTLKSLALGTTVGLFRDMVVKSLPDTLKGEVSKVLDNFTTNLGGKPIQEPVLGTEEKETEGSQARRF